MIEDLEEQITSSCRFCNPLEKQRIIHETNNFYVMLSLGPLVEGYCLLISKQHFSCCAAIPIQLRREFKEIYFNVKTILNNIYGACLCYEHGRAGACLIPLEGSKHCYHAHMHFVPVKINLNEIVQNDFDELAVASLDLFFDLYSKNNGEPYLFIDDDQSTNIYFIDKKIRRQYLRYKVAKTINKEHLWDWVKYQGWDLIESALQILPTQFKHIN